MRMTGDMIHTPGEWLDHELTEQESDEMLAFIEKAANLKESGNLTNDHIIEELSPFMNSVMHFLYRVDKDRHQLHTTPDGVFNADDKSFDMIAYTIDFIAFYLTNKELASELQEIKLPDETATPIDRLTRMFFKNELPFNTPQAVKSGTIQTKQPGSKLPTIIAPVVTISLLDLPPGIDISRNVEAFDNEVFRAVCALQERGNKKFTGHDIYRAMTMNPNALATEGTLQMIDTSWKRLTSIAIKLDTGNVGDVYNFARWIKNRRILEGGDDTLIVQNQHGLCKSTVYTLNEEPILKTYAQHLGQIGRYPAKWLNTPVNKTPELLILQTALFDHIQAIPSISNHIKYETLFDKIDISAPTANAVRQKKNKLRNQIHKMLDYWVSCGMITGWYEVKKGNTIHSVVIDKNTRPKLPEAPKKTVTTP